MDRLGRLLKNLFKILPQCKDYDFISTFLQCYHLNLSSESGGSDGRYKDRFSIEEPAELASLGHSLLIKNYFS